MLLNFSFENFRSFKDLAEFSMVATETPAEAASQHLSYDEDKLIHAGDPAFGILSVTAIYGANAFGKSNFVDALGLIQRLVLDPASEGEELPVNPFFGDPETTKLPTSFNLHILSKGKEYRIFIKLTKDKIIEEKISMVNDESDEVIYHRIGNSMLAGKYSSNGKTNPATQIKAALESSASNALLLSNQDLQEMEDLKPIHDWFSKDLLILARDAKFVYANESDDMISQIGEALRLLDTKIESIQLSPSTLDSASLTHGEVDNLRKTLKPKLVAFFGNSSNDFFMAKIQKGEIIVNSISVDKRDCNSRKFSVNARDESNGTHRLLHILPAFLQLDENSDGKVLVIDEFDKSLHIGMTRGLVRYHLNNVFEGAQSQFIFTTHDIDLIDSHILRNDEIWIVQRNQDGISNMVCLDEYESAKKHKDLRQRYKTHRFGGTPSIFLLSSAQLAEVKSELRT